METTRSIELIESMMLESRKSLHKNSFYFILWGLLLIPAGIIEFFYFGTKNLWFQWPLIGIIGGIISGIYGYRTNKENGVTTFSDTISGYTWGAFGVTLIIATLYSLFNHLMPHALILMLAGSATFISGGISKFKPFVYGGLVLEIGAILCGFFFEPAYHGLIFSVSLLGGYVIPGFLLRNLENAHA